MLYLRRVFHHWKAQSFSFRYKYFAPGVSLGLQVGGKALKVPLVTGSGRGGTLWGGGRTEYVLFINFKGFEASPSNYFHGKDASPGAGRVCVREETARGHRVNNAPPKKKSLPKSGAV